MNELDYDPYAIEPKVGMWVTFCCDCDAERLNDEEDVAEFIENAPLDADGTRAYQGSPCKAYKTVFDLLRNEMTVTRPDFPGGWIREGDVIEPTQDMLEARANELFADNEETLKWQEEHKDDPVVEMTYEQVVTQEGNTMTIRFVATPKVENDS